MSKGKEGAAGKGKDGQDGATPSPWGHGRTDPATWWQKGKPSPNPKGRPKGRKNQKTLYREAFKAKVDVKLEGRATRLTKDEASYIQFANRCAAGDMKAMALKVQLDAKFEDPEPPKPTPQQTELNVQRLDYYIALRKKFAAKEEDSDG